MSARVRFVLVEPREGGNVGAAARAMKNFGFTEMVIAGAAPSLEGPAQWWASGAEDVVAAARIVPSLDAALEGAHAAVATSSARERPLARILNPAEVARLRQGLAGGQTLAVVFGREDRGLTTEEIARCGRSAAIPTSDLHPTMNLAQAIAIFAWELSRENARSREAPRDLATDEGVERFHETARALLAEVGFLGASNPDRVYDELRAVVARAMLDERELAILMGIARQVRWAVGSRNS